MDGSTPVERSAHGGARPATTWSDLMGSSEPLILIGYWATPGDTESRDPDPLDLVDHDQSREERDIVFDYLTRGLLARAYMGRSTCRICGDPENGNLELTDGTFLWPEGLAHYVRDHDVRLPTAFIEHVNQQEDRLSSRGHDGAEWWRRNAILVGLREVFPPAPEDAPGDQNPQP